MGTEVGAWEGLYTAIADTLHEMSGNLLVRTTAAYASGDTSIAVEGTDRFPAAGRIAFGRRVALYASKTATSFDGLTDYYTGAPGVDVDLPPFSVVQDVSRVGTQMEDLRASFLLPTAEGAELDMLARNYGISRPLGLGDAGFRDLLEVWIWLDATTTYACEQILDVLWGPGNYTLFEDLETHRHTVFVLVPWAAELSGDYQGKTYVVGGESQTRTSPTTVTVADEPTLVFGLWAATDPGRAGTNYANLPITTCSTLAGTPTRLYDSGNGFLATDVGKPVLIDDEHWTVAQFVSTGELRLEGRLETDGVVTNVAPTRLFTPTDWFEPWMVGHFIQITSTVGTNNGTYVISEVVSSRQLRLAGASFSPETDVTWQLLPNFGTDASVTAQLPRATWVGPVITAPVTLPVNLLVDYTTVPSAQVPLLNVSGVDQYPFYLWDAVAVTKSVLDLITAAGVQVELVRE